MHRPEPQAPIPTRLRVLRRAGGPACSATTFSFLLRWAGGVKSFELSPRNRRVAVLFQENNFALRRWDVTTLVRDTCALVSRNLSSRSKRRRIVG